MNVIRHEPTRYQPFGRINWLYGNLNRLFGTGFTGLRNTDAGRDWLPSADIQEKDQRYVVHADLPGLAPKTLNHVGRQGFDDSGHADSPER